MTTIENITTLLIIGITLCGVLCMVCYFLGKAEGRAELKAEIDKEMRTRGTYRERNTRKPRIF